MKRSLKMSRFRVAAVFAVAFVVLAAILAWRTPVLVNVAPEGSLTAGVEVVKLPAIGGGRSTSIADGWYAEPLSPPVISHWNVPLPPDGNWVELHFDAPRTLTRTLLYWDAAGGPAGLALDADLGRGWTPVAARQAGRPVAEAIDLPSAPISALRVRLDLPESASRPVIWTEWLVLEQQHIAQLVFTRGAVPVAASLAVAAGALAVVTLSGFGAIRTLRPRVDADRAFVLGIPLGLAAVAVPVALALWLRIPHWAGALPAVSIAGWTVVRHAGRFGLGQIDRRMLALAMAGAGLHVLAWTALDIVAPRHGADTLFPLEVAQLLHEGALPSDATLRDVLWGYSPGYRTPALSLLATPSVGLWPDQSWLYFALIHALGGLLYVPAFALMRSLARVRIAVYGVGILVLSSALLLWSEQVPNKTLAIAVLLVGAYQVASWDRRGLRFLAVSMAFHIGLAFYFHDASLRPAAALVAFALWRAPGVRQRLALAGAAALAVAAATTSWQAWRSAFDGPAEPYATFLLGSREAVAAAGGGLLGAIEHKLAVPIGDQILYRLGSIAELFFFDPFETLGPGRIWRPEQFQTLIGSIGVIVTLLALLALRAPRSRRLAIPAMLFVAVPVLLTMTFKTRPFFLNSNIFMSFMYVVPLAGLAAATLARIGPRLRWALLFAIGLESLVRTGYLLPILRPSLLDSPSALVPAAPSIGAIVLLGIGVILVLRRRDAISRA